MQDQPIPAKRQTSERTRYPGIAKVHARGCAWQSSRCTCTASYQAAVYSAREGKKIRKAFPTLGAAKTWREAAGAVRQGRMRAPTTTTLREAADALVAAMRTGEALTRSGGRYKPAAVRGYARVRRLRVLPALGHVRLSSLERRDVQHLVDRWRAEGLSASTIANTLDPLRVIFRRAIRDGLVAIDPTAGLELPAVRGKRDRVAGAGEAAALIAALPDSERAFWATALYAGLRRGELRALRWARVDFDAGVIRVERSWDDEECEGEVKTDAGRRVVPLVGALRKILAAHKLATGGDGDDLVFGRTASEPFIPTTVRRRALTAWKAAGLSPLTPHEARHTCASYLIDAGLNIKQISAYVGHTDVRTTLNRYGHLLPGNEAQAAAQLDAYLAAAEAGG